MVGNHTHGDVRLLIVAVLLACYVSDGFQYRLEHVGVVVGGLSLQCAHQSLEAHAGVDNLGGKPFQAAVCLAVELHEHEVPDFNHLRVVFVHQLAAGYFALLFFRTGVHMDFRTRTARSRITHFPEVIVFVAIQNVVFRQELLPVRSGFVVAFQSFFGATFEYGGVEVFGVEFQYIHQILPCPGDGFFLEVVAERPVAQHLEHGVVVGIVTYFLQVVVFSAYAKAFLRVSNSFVFRRVVAQNDIFKLVHSRIGEHQRGVILNHHRGRRHYLVTFTFEETLERVSDFVCSQHTLY